MSEGRQVDASDGVFSDTFGVYGTHIYTTAPTLAESMYA